MISIIIINYNVLDHLKSCLKSIYNSDILSEFEIIVIDNNSPEPIDFSDDENKLKIIQFDKNLGFAKAVNCAISQSSGSEILLLNPDTLVHKNTIQILSDYILDNKDVGVVGCKVLFPSGV